MKYFPYRWVKKPCAFPPPKCKQRKRTQWKWSTWTVVVWTPSRHSTLSYLPISLCLFSHEPFFPAPYEHSEMFADQIVIFSCTEWAVINASFPLPSRVCFPWGETTTLRQKWSQGQSCLSTHQAQPTRQRNWVCVSKQSWPRGFAGWLSPETPHNYNTPQNPLAWPVPITARQPVSCFNGSFTWIKLVLWKAQLLRLLIHVVAFKSQNIYAQNSHWYFKHGPVKCNKNATDCAAGSILLTESLNSLHATLGIHLCLELKPIPFPPRVYHQAPLPLHNICKDA